MKKLLIIITGSIAAYKIPELIRLLVKKDYHVTCIVTDSAKEFVTPLTLATVSKNTVYDNMFLLNHEIEHINLARNPDLILVAPATANIIAKIANGIADDLASTTLLATDKPILIAPAMNSYMWSNKATKRNIKQIVEDGVKIIEPETDMLACEEYGVGKMASLETIVDYIGSFNI
jgi:phosphopantothenoylcysteine decarboxylase/phosphopantothenate--cysteine ligase